MFEYNARIVRVIDGDTVVARIDLGFDTSTEQTLRLFGIDAPETRGKGWTTADRKPGHDATVHLRMLLDNYQPIRVHTLKDRTGKFGRYLAVLYGKDDHGPININDQMVRAGHAVVSQ